MLAPLNRIPLLRDWLAQLQGFVDAAHPLGAEARRIMPQDSGLSGPNVDWALRHSLEVSPSDEELAALVAETVTSKRAHVLLSANLFVSPLRAIAIAKAASDRVLVRPSRREPHFVELLHRAAPSAFELVSELAPEPGEHVWAYGSDATMSALARTWPAGVVLHAHGDGHGAFAVGNPLGLSDVDYDAMALDVAAFDQRGCLSPRIVVVQGGRSTAVVVAERLFLAMQRMKAVLPQGRLSEEEQAALNRHAELYRFLGQSYFEPGAALVTIDAEAPAWRIAPSGRALHVTWVPCLADALVAQARALTSLGTEAPLLESLRKALPRARVVPFGWMQRPALDGPVDRRQNPKGIVL